ncbi:uncharacterized protein H6S33_009756 [Morchella sextelata]|uniref:uncharacterized protein n=1 Tax=Morchella sextelata TaxID=1174677 RepID=UPI001D03853D|nr:uncharacterized protein H6S33_009756 [Morchella sextelata]KAH0613376.1 hypothetical protein H6S33_009756 [Morchella sextelata]
MVSKTNLGVFYTKTPQARHEVLHTFTLLKRPATNGNALVKGFWSNYGRQSISPKPSSHLTKYSARKSRSQWYFTQHTVCANRPFPVGKGGHAACSKIQETSFKIHISVI